MSFWFIQSICDKHKISIKLLLDLPDNVLNTILYGSNEPIQLNNTPLGSTSGYMTVRGSYQPFEIKI